MAKTPQTRTDIFHWLGLSPVPWSIRVYLILLVLFSAWILIAAYLNLAPSVQDLLEDAVQMILGALLGALALISEQAVALAREPIPASEAATEDGDS